MYALDSMIAQNHELALSSSRAGARLKCSANEPDTAIASPSASEGSMKVNKGPKQDVLYTIGLCS